MIRLRLTRYTRLIVSLLGILLIMACQQQGETGMSDNAADSGITELQITDVVNGDGATAQAGQEVIVHYTGWLYDTSQPDNKGAKFDSSVDRGDPFSFPLGAGRVIQGWDQGFAGMQIGGKRILVIPPEMGYGASGAGGAIPPNATLIFEVELLEIR
jgi:FKBP-type peptidyl-prolyl cis-trans isomerase FkpA